MLSTKEPHKKQTDMESETLQCPLCHYSLDGSERFCPNCQTNLGIAAAREANQIAAQMNQPRFPVTLEALLPRLGQYLVNRELITPAELEAGLAYQEELEDQGQTKLIGQILVEQGILTRADLDLAVTDQIFQIKDALEQSNHELEQQVADRTAELERALSRLNILNQTKANFIANISHELATPLSHLIGHLEILSVTAKASPIADYIPDIMKSANQLWLLIEDLLQFSDAATGKLKIDLRPIPVQGPVHTAIYKKLPLANQKRVSLKANIASDLPMVRADGEKLTWVMEQLLDNAIKFTPPEGHVVTYVQQRVGAVEVIVIDTGVGISKEKMAAIFQPFSQSQDLNLQNNDGLGLGLATAQKIISGHGTRIKIRSREGIGTNVSFKLFAV